MSATRREPWIDVAVVAAGCLIAWLAYFRPLLAGPTDVPGDLGDARFNIYVLEHVFQWLRGDEVSLLSPGMFWPYPFALAFSDTHAGTAWVYALLRTGGLDQYQSFAIWVVLGYLATYAAAYHVARKLDLGPLVAGAFAFAFAFSLPAISQVGHAQSTANQAAAADSALVEIVAAIRTIASMAERIADATAQQSGAVSEIRGHSERIHSLGGDNLRRIGQSRQQGEQLLLLGGELHTAVQAFRV